MLPFYIPWKHFEKLFAIAFLFILIFFLVTCFGRIGKFSNFS